LSVLLIAVTKQCRKLDESIFTTKDISNWYIV